MADLRVKALLKEYNLTSGPEMSHDEIVEYCQLRQSINIDAIEDHLKIIRKCVVFFTALAAVGLVLGVLAAIL